MFEIRQIMTATWQKRNTTFLILIILINIAYSLQMLKDIKANSTSAKAGHFTVSDSQHYYDIADQFAKFDFRMQYVAQKRAHRQPLYPFLLAFPMKFTKGELFFLASVNVLIAIFFVFLVYFSVSCIVNSRLAGLFSVIFIVSDSFLYDNITTSLLTEPLFILLSFATSVSFIRYISEENDKYFFATALLSGLSYLARPNGLFLTVSMVFVLTCYELYTIIRKNGKTFQPFKKVGIKYLLFLAIFALVSIPSWVPRIYYHGNPIYHQYLPNYLWVDTYEKAHVSGPPRYKLQDYLATHTVEDAVDRFCYGLKRVYYAAGCETRWPYSCLILAGLVIGCFSRKPQYLLLSVFMFIQMLPIVWTNLSNPTLRIPYASLLPFSVIYVAIFVAAIMGNASEFNYKRLISHILTISRPLYSMLSPSKKVRD